MLQGAGLETFVHYRPGWLEAAGYIELPGSSIAVEHVKPKARKPFTAQLIRQQVERHLAVTLTLVLIVYPEPDQKNHIR